MSGNEVILTLNKGKTNKKVEGKRIIFTANKCFAFDDSVDDINCLLVLGNYLKKQPRLAIYGNDRLLGYLLQHVEGLQSAICCVISNDPATKISGIPVCQQIPADVDTIFLTETRTLPRQHIRQCLPANIKIIDLDILCDIALDKIPKRAWTSIPRTIYPVQVPKIQFKKNLDMILLDCPARNLALMPNGIGYVHNALIKTSISFQVFDLDIVTYHHYHIGRLFDEGGKIFLKSGKEMPDDPWQAEHYDLWANLEVIDYFGEIIEQTTKALIEARPKILGLSIHGCNEIFSRKLVKDVKAVLPETIILVGGYSCYNPDIGLRAFPECDYMCIGESDLTVGPLVEALARGELPSNQPGILSCHDSKEHRFIPGPVVHNIDNIEFPKYEWFDLSLYRNYNGYQLTPIIASRGCRWSRCTFCAERFYWRIRSKENFIEEMEWLVSQGNTLFMFNESDLNGIPEKLLEICDEIIKRDLGVRLTGQLRMHKKCDRAFFNKLRAAGFVTLRFGIDAFSENTLRLQKKGYTTEIISQNLKDCWDAGIYTEINWVIGVPGETEDDISEGIELILKNQEYIGRLANINPLILSNGSVYWSDPTAHNIHFREPLEQILERNPRAVPADLWYSTNPYIDANVRKERFERIVKTLYKRGFPVGAWASRVIEDVHTMQDQARTGKSDKIPDEKADGFPGKTASIKSNLLSQSKIVRYRDSFYALDEQGLGDVFSEKADVGDKLNKTPDMQLEVDGAQTNIPPRTALRRLIAMMPGSFKREIRRILDIELYKRRGYTGGRSDSLYTLLILSGLLKEYALKPIRKLMRFSEGQGRMLLGEKIPGSEYSVIHVVTKGAMPELIRTIGNYNIVSFDGVFYGMPHNLVVDWDLGGIDHISGVIKDNTVTGIAKKIKATSEMTSSKPGKTIVSVSKETSGTLSLNTPQRISSHKNYNIFIYEGWYYGIPHSAGELDLSEVDVMGMPGVIRDVSLDVVESEIEEQALQMENASVKK